MDLKHINFTYVKHEVAFLLRGTGEVKIKAPRMTTWVHSTMSGWSDGKGLFIDICLDNNFLIQIITAIDFKALKFGRVWI